MKRNSNVTRAFVLILFALTVSFLSTTGRAQVFSSATASVTLPDGANAPLCTSPGAYVCKSVVVTGLPPNAILTSATIVVADHENVGQLEMEVRSPTGSPTFSPFGRTGSFSAGDCGDSSEAEGEYTFLNGGIGSWWLTAATLGNTEIMPSGTYFPSFLGGGVTPQAGNPNNTMSLTFLGATNGTWNVCLRDWGDNPGGRYTLARLTFAVPTAAAVSVGGRVATAGGFGISNAVVTISGGNLPEPLTTRTSSFGYYSFSGIQAGEIYVVTVSAKRFTFNPPSQIINVQDNIADADFFADGN